MLRSARPRLFLAVLLAALAAGLLLGARPLGADAGAVRSVTAAPAVVAAAGGQSTITVIVAPAPATPTTITLQTTRGAFGSAAGPLRVSVDLVDRGDGTARAQAILLGTGRPGPAAVTASLGDSVRAATVTFVAPGAPAAIVFETPRPAAVRDAVQPVRLQVQVRDAAGQPVAERPVTFTASAGRLASPADPDPDPAPAAAGAGRRTVATDAAGRAVAVLRAAPGPVELRAVAGAASATLALTLHGPPAQLELVVLAPRISLGDRPFPAPPETLVALAFDAGGRPVPRLPVAFASARAGVTVAPTVAPAVTDAAGRVTAHVSAADATATGAVTITARAGDLSASAALRIVGPAARLQLVLTPRDAPGAYGVAALVTDGSGAAVPSGYQVRFSAVGATPSAMPAFDPVTAATLDGLARTVFTLDGATAGVRVRAYVAGIDTDVRASAPLPASGQAASIALAAGLNLIPWPGPALPAAAAVAAIADQVTAIWRFDAARGWQSSAPAAARGVDFLIAPGDWLAVTTRAAVVWVIPAAAEADAP